MSTLSTITGVYRDGQVELSQRPEGLGEDAAVLVTFLPANGTAEAEREEIYDRFEHHSENPR